MKINSKRPGLDRIKKIQGFERPLVLLKVQVIMHQLH